MKKIILLFTLLIANSIFSQNIAFISQDSILKSIPKFQINLSKIDSLKKTYEEEIKNDREKVTTKVQKLLASYNLKERETLETIKSRLSATDKSTLELLIEEDAIIDKRTKNYDSYLKTEYDKNVQPILNKINKTISNYAVKNKLDVVYILEQFKQGIAYYDVKKDITKIIIIELNRL